MLFLCIKVDKILIWLPLFANLFPFFEMGFSILGILQSSIVMDFRSSDLDGGILF